VLILIALLVNRGVGRQQQFFRRKWREVVILKLHISKQVVVRNGEVV